MNKLVNVTLLYLIMIYFSFLNTKSKLDKNILKFYTFIIFLVLLGIHYDNLLILIISHSLFWIALYVGSFFFSDINNIILILLIIIITSLTRYTNKNKQKCLFLNVYGNNKKYKEKKEVLKDYILEYTEQIFLLLVIILTRLIHRKK